MEYTKILLDTPSLIRILKLTVPFIIAAIEVAFLYLFLDYPSFLLIISLMIAYILPPAGKETVIPAGIFLGIPWWLMALSIMMIDIETALFMGWNFDLALKIPVLGRIMESFIRKSEVFIKEHPWVKNLYFTGIVVLVMVPVMGSGGIRGSIIGNLLGMQKIPLFLAIVTGSFIGCFGIALAAVFLKELFIQSIFIGIVVVAGIIVITLLVRYYWKMYHPRTPPVN
ncbi:MAG: small multi-drug export protein [Methanoregula sp.]|nr:small multi-drug export protein [Methanoregula sp.]